MSTWTIDDWKRLDVLGSDLVLHAALRLALQGQAPSITTLLEGALNDPALRSVREDHLLEKDMRTVVRVRGRAGERIQGESAEDFVVRQEFFAAGLPWCAGLALSIDPAKRSSKTLDSLDLNDLFSSDMRHVRTEWSVEDDRLVQAACTFWRHDVEAMQHFFSSCTRFARHAGMVDSFLKAGVDLDLLLDSRYRDIHCELDKGHQMPAPLEMLVFNGVPESATKILRQLDVLVPRDDANPAATLARARDLQVDELLQQMTDPKSVQSRWIVNLLLDARRDEPGQVCGQPSMARRIVDLFNELSRWQTGNDMAPDTDPVRGGVAKDYKAAMARLRTVNEYLREVDKLESAPDLEFVNVMVMERPLRGPSVAEIMNLTQYTAADHHTTSECDLIGACASLAYRLAASHCADSMRACAGYLERMTPNNQGQLMKCAAMAGANPAHDAPLDPQAFRSTVEALRDAGLPVFGSFRDSSRNSGEARRSTFLHAIAESGHDETCQAMLIAVEVGCDHGLRNERGWLAGACIDDKLMKAQWSDMLKSHLARQAASAAMAEISADLLGNLP